MTKIKAEELGCFQQVANVIGEASAKVELQKVVDAGWIRFEDDCLYGAFEWECSPQKHSFWSTVQKGNIPEGYRPLEAVVQKDTLPQRELFIRYTTHCYILTFAIIPLPEGHTCKEVVDAFKEESRAQDILDVRVLS